MSLHAILRARERYGLVLLPEDIARLTRTILAGDALLAARHSATIEEWYVDCQGIRLRIVFESQRRFVITIIPCGRRDHRPTCVKGRGRRRMQVRRHGRPPAEEEDEREAALG